MRQILPSKKWSSRIARRLRRFPPHDGAEIAEEALKTASDRRQVFAEMVRIWKRRNDEQIQQVLKALGLDEQPVDFERAFRRLINVQFGASHIQIDGPATNRSAALWTEKQEAEFRAEMERRNQQSYSDAKAVRELAKDKNAQGRFPYRGKKTDSVKEANSKRTKAWLRHWQYMEARARVEFAKQMLGIAPER